MVEIRKGQNMKKNMKLMAMAPALLATLCTGTILAGGDGSDEPGFVPPPEESKLPPPPPRSIAGSENMAACCCCPVTPMSRSEAKKPPLPPVMFTKIKTDKLNDWAATPNDVNNLLKSMKDMMNVNYIMEIKSMGEISPDPEQNPVLYRSGHYHFEFSPQEREKLRKFMLDGGMVIFNTGLGSKPFYDSAKKELDTILPEVHLQRLSSDHPIFHSYYDVDRVRYRPGVGKGFFAYQGNEPWFDGVTINCRTVALISRWCMAVGWQDTENDTYQAYQSEDAKKLGVNLFSYAVAQRAWAKNAATKMTFVDADATTGDKVNLAQVVYDGEWKTRHAGLSVLLQTFNLKTEVPVKYGLKEMRLSDPKIFDAPLLYITGHEDFRLKKEEAARLRQYLANGGFLFAEACCGRKGFDLAFRQQMQALFPEAPLKPVPEGSPLFNLPNKITRVGVTPALAQQLGSPSTKPELEAIEIDGHYAVIYSRYGLAGGWEMSQSPYAFGYDGPDSVLLGQDVLMYAITQ